MSHPHLLVLIDSFTKIFMILGLTSVDFYHPLLITLYSPGWGQASIAYTCPYTCLGWGVEINSR